ncbi:MAG TPA: extracellular solute-binding protein [Dongiaceae bacterium]|nr:extracellular solute-binding protein [Dongiaceae bacterium]
MARIKLRGMTWGHRRAIDPLLAVEAEFERQHPGIEIEWASRPLHGFEFTPVPDLARQYDLIVLDHPFCGEIAASECLLPIDDVVAAAGGDCYVGPSLATYRYEGWCWALPIDAACQVAVARPDLMAKLGETAPADWRALLDLGAKARDRGLRLAIGLRGVHSLMTFFTLAANLGKPCATDPGQPLIDRETARTVLSHMRQLLAYCPPEALDWNSIELHDAMAARDDLAFCPAVYCYATYAESDHAHPLRFHDFPGPNGPAGSTIGGTGLGLSAHGRAPEAALAYARFCAQPETQRLFAAHHGQPARREAWTDPAIDARFGGCYSATLRTMDQCWVRPRFKGYLAFQARAGDLIEQHLRGVMDETRLLDSLQRAFEAAGKAGLAG